MARTTTANRDPRRSPSKTPADAHSDRPARCPECAGARAAARGYCFSCGRVIPFADEGPPAPVATRGRAGQPTAHA